MFDKIVCLNVDKRISEQTRLKEEFSKNNLDLEFYLAGKGTLFPAYLYSHVDIEPPTGRIGYPAWVNRPNSYNAFLCYKKIIQQAKKDNLESITLVEDDCTLLENFSEIVYLVKEELKSLPDWDMFYFCSCHAWTNTEIISPHILKLSGSGGFQLVSIRRTLFDTFINAPMNEPIDGYAGHLLHSKYNCYAAWPNIAIPRPGYSECEGCIYDNTELYKIRGC